MIQSQADAKGQSQDLKAERLHAIFKVVLATFVDAQKEGALDNVSLTFGHHTKRVNLKSVCFFVIGDMQGGDKITCTSASYSNTMRRMCGKYNVKGFDAGDPFIESQRMSMVKIIDLVRRNLHAILDNINQYNVHSAWFDVDYGGCCFGIFSAATPVEPLHALENGLITDCVQILFEEEMTTKQKRQLDIFVRRSALLPRQRYVSSGAESLMPRLLWKDGITSLSKITAKYKVGIMFTIVTVSLHDEGKSLFEDVLRNKERLNDMRQVFQMMLGYWVWLKKETYWVRGDVLSREGARKAIQTMLRDLNQLWPRSSGQGWEGLKLTSNCMPDDIERNGAVQNYHTGPTEHNHIFHVKRLACATQRRRETPDQQIANQASESYVIDYAYQHMATGSASVCPLSSTDGELVQSSKGLLYVVVNENGGCVGLYQPTTGNLDATDCLYEGGLQFLANQYGAQPSSTDNFLDNMGNPCNTILQITSEYKRGNETFRAHRNYQGRGPWYDLVMFRWKKSTLVTCRPECCVEYLDNPMVTQAHDYAPRQIVTFVVCPVPNEATEPAQILAVAKTCGFLHKKGSIVSTIWQQEFDDSLHSKPSLVLVNVDCIVRHCLMLPMNQEQSCYQEMWHRERWADESFEC
jgi:hypothetical protein